MTTRVHVQSWLISQMDQEDFEFGVHATDRYRTSIAQSLGFEGRPDSPLLGAEHPAHAITQPPKQPSAETDYTQAVNALMEYDSDEDASERDLEESMDALETEE